MQRSHVYRAIDSERAYQQAQGKPDERQWHNWRYSIKYYLDKLEFAPTDASKAIVMLKVAALAVAALEQYGCEPRQGHEQSAPAGRGNNCPYR